jgi:transcriptional regulator with XRE-family HTH domain
VRGGEQLKELRNHLGITTREVEEHSRKVADAENNTEFYISNAWLTQLENTQSNPSLYKLYSLSVIYRVKFTDLLLIFGVDLNRIARHQANLRLDATHLTNLEIYDPDRKVSFPVRFDPGFSIERTNLLSRMIEVWGDIPIALIQHLDVRRGQYGYIGLEDHTMYPLLRPGSFVQIDSTITRVQVSKWSNEFDRPVYFVELRDGYACSWCELHGSQLTLIPHPLSGCSIRQYAYPTEAEIVGRITAVAMRLVDPQDHSDDLPRLPKRS